jgi:hypothetical protein
MWQLLMQKHLSLVLINLAVFTLPSLASGDTFVVTAMGLSEVEFPAGTRIQLVARKQLAGGGGGAITAGSTFRPGRILFNQEIVAVRGTAVTFNFSILRNDPGLATNDDRAILFELFRDGARTAVVPFIVVAGAGTQTMTVAVPERQTCSSCEFYGHHRGRGLFRHRR